MDERIDQLWKIYEAEERIEDLVRSGVNAMGIDVGTSTVVAARRRGKDTETAAQLNAFIAVPYSRFTETTLGQNAVSYYRDGDELIVYGTDTAKFANMFNVDARRPMSDGMLNPKEKTATPVLEAILQGVVPKARTAGDVLAFSVPAANESKGSELTYHEATLRHYFESQGYKAVAINEGLAVVFSELEDQNFSGIGISFGGGMCNATLAFLSIPSILYSIPKGGDYIDAAVGAVTNEHATRIKALKEESLDLSRAPRDKLERALHIYYEDLVQTLIDGFKKAIARAEKLPRVDRPITVLLSGGTSKPKGFRELFERAWRQRAMPIEISEIRLARDPFTATARGALIAALYEK